MIVPENEVKKEIRHLLEKMQETEKVDLYQCMMNFYSKCTGYRLSPGYRLNRVWKERLGVLFTEQQRELYIAVIRVFILCTCANRDKRICDFSVLKETDELRKLEECVYEKI